MYFCSMFKVSKIFQQTFSFFLLIYILSCNIHVNYYFNLLTTTTFSKYFEYKENQNLESKTTESSNSDDTIDDFYSENKSLNYLKSISYLNFGFIKSNFIFTFPSFPKIDYEIQSPPPESLI